MICCYFWGILTLPFKEDMDVKTSFGSYSGLSINWAKSALIPLYAMVSLSVCILPCACDAVIQVSGMYISPIIMDYCAINIIHIRYKTKTNIWNKL